MDGKGIELEESLWGGGGGGGLAMDYNPLSGGGSVVLFGDLISSGFLRSL